MTALATYFTDADGTEHDVDVILYRGVPHWIARQVGAALDYARDGERLVTAITAGEWSEFERDVDYVVVEGDDLRDLKSLPTTHGAVGSRAPRLVLLTESGVNLVILRAESRHAGAFKLWLAREVMPQLARDGKYLPEREVTPAGELRERRRPRWIDRGRGIELCSECDAAYEWGSDIDGRAEHERKCWGVAEWDEQVTQVGEARADRAAEREARLAEQRERTRQIELETAAAREAAQAERLRVEAVDRHAGAAELSALADDVAERDRALAARLRIKQLEHAYGVALGELGELYVTAMSKPPDALTAAMAIVGGVQAPALRRPRSVMPPGRTSAGREQLPPGWHWCTDIAIDLGISPGVLGKRVVKPLGIKGDPRYSRLATIDSRDGTRHQVFVYNDAGRARIEAEFRELDSAGAFRKRRGKTNGVRAQA